DGRAGDAVDGSAVGRAVVARGEVPAVLSAKSGVRGKLTEIERADDIRTVIRECQVGNGRVVRRRQMDGRESGHGRAERPAGRLLIAAGDETLEIVDREIVPVLERVIRG